MNIEAWFEPDWKVRRDRWVRLSWGGDRVVHHFQVGWLVIQFVVKGE
jgi:hypothetical protein